MKFCSLVANDKEVANLCFNAPIHDREMFTFCFNTRNDKNVDVSINFARSQTHRDRVIPKLALREWRTKTVRSH